MTTENIMEVLGKLIGSIEPYGDSNIDSQRLANVEQFLDVLDEMHTMLDDVVYRYKDYKQKSIRDIVDTINNHRLM